MVAPKPDFTELSEKGRRMQRAMGRAVAKALREHKLLGRSVVQGDGKGGWRIVPPEEIEIPDIPDEDEG